MFGGGGVGVTLFSEYEIIELYVCAQKHGIKYVFTLCGGHISPILVACEKIGIRVVDTRHEVNWPSHYHPPPPAFFVCLFVFVLLVCKFYFSVLHCPLHKIQVTIPGYLGKAQQP